MANKGIIASLHIKNGTVTRDLLDASVVTELDNLRTSADQNTAGIQAINDAKGNASGFAPLDADSKIPMQFIHARAIERVVTVGTEAEMLALNISDVQNGDTVVIATGDAETQKTYQVTDESKLDELAGYTELLFSSNRSLIMRAGTAQTGQVALSEAAFTGAANDVTIEDSAGLYDATTTEAAFAEVMGAANDAAQAATDAKNDATAAATMINGTLTPVVGSEGRAWKITQIDPAKKLFFSRDTSGDLIAAGFATVSADVITLHPDVPAFEADEVATVVGYPN